MNKKSDSERFTKVASDLLLSVRDLVNWGLDTGNTTPEKMRLTVTARKEAAVKLIEGGMSQRQTAKVLGVDQRTIRRDLGQSASKSEAKSLTGGAAAKADAGRVRWTPEQSERKEAVGRGECVVANMREGTDDALVAWAQETDCFVRIDRTTAWGNPFEIPDDGDREQVIRKFAEFYFPHKDSLLAKLESLRGKVLGCWCHPEECHGHFIAELVNRHRTRLGPPIELIDQMIDERKFGGEHEAA